MAMAMAFHSIAFSSPWAPQSSLKVHSAAGKQFKALRFPRPAVVVASAESTAGADSDQDSDARRALKDALAEHLEESKGNLDEQSLQLVSSLEALNPVADLKQVPHLYKGCFQGLRASFKNSGKKGEFQKEVGYSGAIVTLGRATFNVFKPASMDIVLDQTFNHVGHDFEDEYSLIIRFKVASEQDLEGLLINRAKFSISGPKRMDVVFSSSTMKPRYPEKDLERWIRLFQGDNPGLDDASGAVSANLPAAKGWLDYLYLDEELRITRGNRGGVSVVQRLDEPLVSI